MADPRASAGSGRKEEDTSQVNRRTKKGNYTSLLPIIIIRLFLIVLYNVQVRWQKTVVLQETR